MRALVYGAVNPDLVHAVDRIPQPGDDIRSRGWFMAWGGKACNAAMALAGWGVDARLLGLPIGRDAMGDALLRLLDVPNLDASRLERSEDPGRHCVVLVTPDGDRTIVCAGYEGAAWQPVPEKAWEGVAVALLDGFAGAAAVEAAHAALERGIPTVWLDAPQPVPAAVDLVVWSRHEHGRDAAARVAAAGIDVVLTAGADPVVLFTGRKRIAFTPPQIAVVDATGSGDVFAAGCAYGLGRGWEIPRTVEFAAAAGSAAAARRRMDRPGLEDVAALLTVR